MTQDSLGPSLALVNACLNGLSGLLLVGGYLAIRRGDRARHPYFMGGAFLVSALFLVSYLVRVALTGTHRYPGDGLWKAVYLGVLGTHMLLAIAVPPLAIRSIWLARRGRLDEHRRLVRITLPAWLYVSATGVLVYLLLYHPPG